MKSIFALLTALITLFIGSFLQAEEPNSLVGKWSGKPEGGSAGTVILEFNEDGTGKFQVGPGAFDVEYTLDRSVTPHQLKFVGTPPGAKESQTMHSILEFVDADTIKMAEPAPKPPESFDEGAPLTAKRVVDAPDEVGSKLIGQWLGFENGDADDPILLEFKEDGSGTLQEGNSEEAFTFQTQGDAAPYGLTLVIDGRPASTILEFQDENTVKIEEPSSSSADGEFTEDAILFERLQEMDGDPKELIVGNWTMGDQVSLQLNEDGSGTLIDGEDEQPIQYEFTVSEEGPLQLDLTIEGEKQYSLAEFLGNDRIRITEPSAERPESMEQAGVLIRQESE